MELQSDVRGVDRSSVSDARLEKSIISRVSPRQTTAHNYGYIYEWKY